LSDPVFGRASRLALPLAIGAILFASSLLFFQQSGELYVIDEAEFPLVAKAIADTGRPVYYRGEDLPANVGIWHPPLYAYTLGVWVELFGSSHVAVRSFGFACALIAAALGWLVIRRLFPERHRWLGTAWLGIFLLHPYGIQSALLPDIDSTVLVASSMFALWALTEAVVARRWSPIATSVLFGVVLGVNLLAKLTTPIALIPLLIVGLALSTRSARWTLGGTLIFSAVGATVFCAVWGGIAAAAHLDFGYPFTFTYDSLVSRSGSKGFEQHIEDLRPSPIVLFWLTPILIITFVAGTLATLTAARRRAGQGVLLIAFFATMVFFAYNVITGPPFGFPKYYAPALGPAAIVALAPFGLSSGASFAWRRPWTRSLFGAVVLAAAALVISSYLEYPRDSAAKLFPERPVWFLIFVGLLVVASLALLVRPLQLGHRAHIWGLGLLAATLIVLVGTNVATAMRQRSAPGSVRYFPGERDFSVTIAKLRALDLDHAALEHATLVSAKDVGYESGVRYYEDDFYLPDPARLAKLLRSSPNMLMVTRSDYDFSAIVWPKAFAMIKKVAHPIWVSPTGTFTIWKTDTPRKGGR
jgi:4-amino-4-deoxy-L-arabinose transferase-like glycosyltransferase